MRQKLFAATVSLLRRRPRLKYTARPVFRRLIDRNADSKVRWILRWAYSHSKFYRNLMREAGVTPDDIRGADDLQKMPTTSPKDLSADPYQFLCVPVEEVGAVYSTAGTTGRPKLVFFTREEIERTIQLAGTILRPQIQESRRRAVQIMFAYGRPSWGAGYISQRIVECAGGLPIPASNSLSPWEQLELIERFRPISIVGTASYVYRVTEELSNSGADLRSYGVRRIGLGAEAWPERVRTYLEEKWGAKVSDSYGLTEATFALGSECDERSGLHLNEVDHYVEVVDPETGERVSPGEDGEVVFTTLSRRAMPFIRYRTGDVASPVDGACGCGSPTRRISRIKGRTDDMFTLGTGENMYPSFFDDAILGIPSVVDYQLIITGEGMRDSILVRVEARVPSEELRARIRDAVLDVRTLRHDLEVTRSIMKVEVEFASPPENLGSDSSQIKRRRVLDLRQRYPE